MFNHFRVLLATLVLVCSAHELRAEVINAGVGGNRSHDLLKRLDRDVLSKKPNLVVVMAGTNDRLNSGGFVDVKDYRKNIQTLIARIRSAGAKVVLVTPPTCIPQLLFSRHAPEKFAGQTPMARMKEVREILIDVARKENVALVDFHQHLIANKIAGNGESSVIRNIANSGTKDGVHLTPRGYRILAEMVAAKIRAEKLERSTTVCLGDSLTRGSAKANYPAYLDEILAGQKN